MNRRPRDMSNAELEALPVGPYIERIEPLTEADYAAGRVGKTKTTYEYRPVRVVTHEPDDMLAWRDKGGNLWTFGQWEDGSWYRQPSPLSVIPSAEPRKAKTWGKTTWGKAGS